MMMPARCRRHEKARCGAGEGVDELDPKYKGLALVVRPAASALAAFLAVLVLHMMGYLDTRPDEQCKAATSGHYNGGDGLSYGEIGPKQPCQCGS